MQREDKCLQAPGNELGVGAWEPQWPHGFTSPESAQEHGTQTAPHTQVLQPLSRGAQEREHLLGVHMYENVCGGVRECVLGGGQDGGPRSNPGHC